MFRILCIFLTVTILKISADRACTSFDKVWVQLKDKNELDFNKTIDGCIERIEFGDTTVTQALIRFQNISKLGRDSVRNMKYLWTISFWGCNMDVIEPIAFRNVPGLKNVQISYCNLTEIPTGVFNLIPNLQLLRIHNNQISVIENQAFSNLTELKKIYGDHNKLEYWNREWFDDSPYLEIMNFQYNKIRTIPRKAFAALVKLREIYFDYNEIETIQPEAFKGLKYLRYLGLRNNRLTELKGDIFPNEMKVRSMLISANYLNFISDEVLKQLSVNDIVMDYNPWKCACLDRITYWLYTTNGTLRSSDGCHESQVPVCVLPKTYSHTCLEYVDDEVTERYLNVLRNLSKPLNEGCARLDIRFKH